MNRAKLVKMAKISLLSLMASGGTCLADDISFAETIASIASTNALATWEGEYVFREAKPLNVGDTNLCLCLYGSESAGGTLLEIYRRETDSVRKVLPAEVNIKGVTPVILQFGTFTNRTSCCYWSRWRHPGNGGNEAYVMYEMTNGLLSACAHFEYCDMGAGKSWHVVDADDNYVVTNGVPASDSVVLWANTNTTYSVASPFPQEVTQFGTGAYVSANSRKGKWETGVIAEISARLQQELPGLKGFSPSSIKYMRQFFETWCPTVIHQSMIDELETDRSFLPVIRQSNHQLTSDVNRQSAIGDLNSAADENPSIGIVLCREANRGFVEMAIRDMSKPMGVAVFRSDKRMPRVYRQLEPMLKGLTEIVEG